MNRIESIIIFIFGCFLMLVFNHAQARVVEQEGLKINVPDHWVESLFVGAFIEADFTFVDTHTGDMMVVDVVPRGYLVNLSEPLSQEAMVSTLQLFAAKHGAETFLKEEEKITDWVYHSETDNPYIYYVSKAPAAITENQVLIVGLQDHLMLVKIINKQITTLNKSQLHELVTDMQPVATTTFSSGKKFFGGHFSYKLMNESEKYLVDEDLSTDETFDYFNAGYYESDRVSRYLISSQCSGQPVPGELYLGLVLDDFGIENIEFSGEIKFNGATLPLLMTRYTADDDGYHVMGTVIEDVHCQHALAYVTKEENSLSDRFFDFMNDVHLIGEPFNTDSLPAADQARYEQTITGLADDMMELEMYQKASQLYAGIKLENENEKVFYGRLRALYHANKYAQVLALIEQAGGQFDNNKTRSWKAWSEIRLKQYVIAIETFKIMSEHGPMDDEDVFKYLELLASQSTDAQMFFKMANKFREQVRDPIKMDYMVVKRQAELKVPTARKAINKLLKHPKVAKRYQFDLMDLLGESSWYEDVESFCLDRIEKGYESAGLYNYLGDAQNRMEKYEAAYESMLKAQKLAPHDSNIESYVRSLRKKVGKSNLSQLSQTVKALPLPEEIADKVAALNPIHSDSSYEYLYQVSVYRHIKGQRNKKTLYGKIKINNQSGVRHNKTFKFSFDSEYENITVNKFMVSDSQGRLLTELDQSTLYVSDDDDQFVDSSKILNIPVPSIGPGVTIEWVVSVASQTNDLSQEFIEMDFVSKVGHQFKAMVFQGDWEGIEVDHSPEVQAFTSTEGWRYWTTDRIENYKKTPYLPDLQRVFPWVKLSSVKPSWQQVGSDYLKMIDAKINTDLSQEIVKLGLVTEGLSEVEKVQYLASYVQQKLTYQALEFGWRAVIPNASELTIKNRYGDCKDHAVLLYDLLNSAGIKAHLALVNTDNDISKELATMNQFDHMIVYVPEVGGGMYLDTTDKDTSFFHYNPPSTLQNHHILALDQEGPYLQIIPPADGRLNTIDVERWLSDDEHNYLYQEQVLFQGYLADNLRNYLKGIEMDEVESRIMSWVSSYYPDITLNSFEYNNLYNLKQPLQLTFYFSQSKAFVGNRLPVFTERYVMDFSQAPNRQWDFEIENAFSIKSTTRKNGSKVKFKRAEEAIKDELLSWQIDANKNQISFQAEVYAAQRPAGDYGELIRLSKQGILKLEALVK